MLSWTNFVLQENSAVGKHKEEGDDMQSQRFVDNWDNIQNTHKSLEAKNEDMWPTTIKPTALVAQGHDEIKWGIPMRTQQFIISFNYKHKLN